MEESYKDHLYVLIICGGAGTRLWPRSIKQTPKQFLEKFYGQTTLFRQTVERAKLLTSPDKIFVITVAGYEDEVLSQAKDILPQNVIAEPVGKNTAMAIGVGSAYVKKIDPKAVIANFWADAVIEQNDKFVEKLSLAAKTAFEGNYLVAVGIKPTFPHMGLGYLEAGELFSQESDVFKVRSFKEKPDLATAQEFLSKGNYFWNVGIYVWSESALFEAFSKYSPDLFSRLETIFEVIGTPAEKETFLRVYNEVESVPIDVAVSEKADNLLLVTADFIWSDIGDWKVVYDLKSKDENGNVIEAVTDKGWFLGIETKNCLIGTQDKLIATIGLSDLVIVQTEKAVLICPRDRTQEVKQIVAALKEKDRKDCL